MATFEQFKENEATLYKKLYRETLKDSVSSFLDSQDRKVAAAIEKYMAQLAYIYGEHILNDVVFSGEMVSKNIEKKIEKSLLYIKSINEETGMPEQKFYSIMELCKYPLDLLKANAKKEGYDIQKAVDDAVAEIKPLVDGYYDAHEQDNQQFNWNGYVNAYHNILNKYIDQASRGNDFKGLAAALEKLNSVTKFASSENKFEILNEIRKAYNNSTNFNSAAVTKESVGTYKLNNGKICDSLLLNQMYLLGILKTIPNGQNFADIQNQIDYIERLVDVIAFSKNSEDCDVLKFFLNTDREDMVAQLLKNVNSDWDIVSKLSNTQCKKIMQNIDNCRRTKAYMVVKYALSQYVRENYEKYVSADALKNPNILAREMINLSRYCEQNSVSNILKLGPGVPDTALRFILDDIQKDKFANIVDIIPVDLQKQIVQDMANKKLSNNRILFDSWKYSTDKFISATELLDRINNIPDDFQNENSIPKNVALSILWENVLALNRVDYYIKDNASSKEIADVVEELEVDGVYADWSDKATANKIWEGRNFEQELDKVEGIYEKYVSKLSAEEEIIKK